MKLQEFTKPEYSKMTEEELLREFDSGLKRLADVIDGNITHESRQRNTKSVSSVPAE